MIARYGIVDGVETLLDGHADTAGAMVASPGAGVSFIAWDRTATSPSKADGVFVCRMTLGGGCSHPVPLHLPATPAGSYGDPTAPFPVVGYNSKDVYVVAPRYGAGDVVVWTSVNGGANFAPPKTFANYAAGTAANDVLLTPFKHPDGISIDSNNPSLGYTWVTPSASSATSQDFDFGAKSVEAGALGADGAELVEAFSTVGSPPRIGYYYDESDVNEQSNQWAGPHYVGDGTDPLLAEGPFGLLLIDYYDNQGAGELQVRTWSVAHHSFGAATVLARDTTSADEEIGAISWDIVGNVYVVWPGTGSDGTAVMRMWVYSPYHHSWAAPVDIANIVGEYQGPAHIAVYGGKGVVSFRDSNGLELVDLYPKLKVPGHH